MSRLSVKSSSIKLEIQINEQVKFGKVAYRPDDPISKVLLDLKRIKILPDCIQEHQVKYYNKVNQEIPKAHEFSMSFDVTDANHLLKINVPEHRIDMIETTKRADDYIRTNKEKRNKLKEMSEADQFVKNLKQIFIAICEENYRELGNLCENQEYLSIIEDFANQHRHLINLARVYERIIELVMEEKEISIKYLPAAKEIKDSTKEKIDAWVIKLNDLRDYEALAQLKVQALKKEVNDLKAALQQEKNKNQMHSESLYEKDSEIKLIQAEFSQYQKDFDDKVKQLQSTVDSLRQQNGILQHKYSESMQQHQKYLQQLKQSQKAQQESANIDHLKDYVTYFASKDSILNQLALNHKYCNRLLQEISYCIPNLTGFKLLYKHNTPTVVNFHKLVDFKDNIFLIAKTKNGRIIGGFSNLPIEPANRRHSPSNILDDVKSFLFNIFHDQLNFFPIKPRFNSVEHDKDYIIFGNEEICIDIFSAKVSSQFVKTSQNYLHFNDPQALRSYFISDSQEVSAQLFGYQAYQLLTQ